MYVQFKVISYFVRTVAYRKLLSKIVPGWRNRLNTLEHLLKFNKKIDYQSFPTLAIQILKQIRQSLAIL